MIINDLRLNARHEADEKPTSKTASVFHIPWVCESADTRENVSRKGRPVGVQIICDVRPYAALPATFAQQCTIEINLMADIWGESSITIHKDSGLEIDFVMRYRGEAVLMEVKATSGNVKSTNTVLNHSEKYHVGGAIKLGDYNVGRSGRVLTLPLYMGFLLTER